MKLLLVGNAPPGPPAKWEALAAVAEIALVARGHGGGGPVRLLSGGRVPGGFYAAAVRALARGAGAPDVVLAQSPFEAAAVLAAQRLGGWRAPVVIELHGDWRTAGRAYGSPARRALAPLADAVAAAALRRCAGLRPVSPALAELARAVTAAPVLAVFPAFMDLEPLLERPLAAPPVAPAVVWIGALEPVKGIRELADVWAGVRAQVPSARLTVLGDGSGRAWLERRLGDAGVTFLGQVDAGAVANALDAARLLLCTSRHEGYGRALVEAAARGRPVVAPAVGAIPDRFAEAVRGRLVAPDGLAPAVVELLADRAAADALGRAARAALERDPPTAARYAAAVVAVAGAARR